MNILYTLECNNYMSTYCQFCVTIIVLRVDYRFMTSKQYAFFMINEIVKRYNIVTPVLKSTISR